MSSLSWRDTLRPEARRLFSLAWPVALGQVGFMMMGVVDVVVAGRVSRSALASVSLGHLFSFLFVVFGWGVLRGLDPFFAQAHGQDDEEAFSATLIHALSLSLLLSLPLCVLHGWSAPILGALGQPQSVIGATGAYTAALIPGLLPLLLFTALSQALQGQGKMLAPMLVVLGANVLNLALNLMLVPGVPALGIPAMGPVGTGVATSIVRLGMLGALVWGVRGWIRQVWPEDWRRFATARALGKSFRVGLPVGVQSSLEMWAFSMIGLMMGVLGEVELAAHAVALNVVSLTYMVPLGIGAAAATRVGNLVGASQPWRQTAWLALGFATGWMLCSGAVLLVGARPITLFYTQDPPVLALCTLLLPLAGGFQLFDGIQVTLFGVLRGAGDVQIPAWINALGYWGLGLPFAWVVGVKWTGNPLLVWGGVAGALVVVASLMLWRLHVVLGRGAKVVWQRERER